MTFARRTYERKPQPLYAPVERRGTYARADVVIAISKTKIVRSEVYRRLVAAMPCKNCGVVGYSQHAHANEGKGMAMKTDDRTGFPLCCDRPGVRGCHSSFDQGAVFSREARRLIEQAWSADTRRQIIAAGEWPANLPLWSES